MTIDRLTCRNAGSATVVCKAPVGPELKDIGRSATLDWCSVACEAHGFEWNERRTVEKYSPLQCLPYEDRRPHGLVSKADGEVPDCLHVLFKDGTWPDEAR